MGSTSLKTKNFIKGGASMGHTKELSPALKHDIKIHAKAIDDLYDLRKQFKNKVIIELNHRGVKAKTPKLQERTLTITGEMPNIVLRYFSKGYYDITSIIHYLKATLQNMLHGLKVYENFLRKQYFVDEVLAGYLIGYLKPTVPYPSSFWAYCGFAPIRIVFNKRIKKYFTTHTKAKFFDNLDERNKYVKAYIRYFRKLGQSERWSNASPVHKRNASFRYAMKEFLKDLYLMWRNYEGLEVKPQSFMQILEREDLS